MAFDEDAGLWSAIHRQTSYRELTYDTTETYKGNKYLFIGEFDEHDACISVELELCMALRYNSADAYEALSEEEKTELHDMAIDSINLSNRSNEP